MPNRHEFVAVDLETTGLSTEDDRIVEIGAIRFEPTGRELARFERLVDPGRSIPPRAEAIHGISAAMLEGAADIGAVLDEFVAFLGDPGSTMLLAHHASFDAGFLGRAFARLGRPLPGHAILDTLAMARSRLPGEPSYRLAALAERLGLDRENPHRGLADARRAMGLWLALGGDDPTQPPPIAVAIVDPRLSAAVPIGCDDLLEAIAGGLPVRIEYAGGTRGDAPRLITPRQIIQRGGAFYVVALCHFSASEKEFRLDRVRRREVVVG